jgi:protein TonB
MPHELFDDVVSHRAPRARYRRVLTVSSIVFHIVIVTAVVIGQGLTDGSLLPVPQRPLTFTELRPVKIVEPPAAPRRRPSDATAPRSMILAPIVEPTGISPETGHESDPARSIDPSIPEGTGATGLDPLGVVEGVAPPAPPTPQTPIHLHSGMQAPVKIVHVAPGYPAIAQTARVQGVVILEAVIDAKGSVTSVSVLRSIPLLDQAAVDAVRQWRFTPARLNDQAVPVVMTVTVNFQLDR